MKRFYSSIGQVAPSPQHTHQEKQRLRASSPVANIKTPASSTQCLATDLFSHKADLFSPKTTRSSSLFKAASTPNIFSPGVPRRTSAAVPSSGMGCTNDQINVYLRIRPLNDKEITQGGGGICLSSRDNGTDAEITCTSVAYGPVKETFAFHRIFDADASQEDIFTTSTLPLIDNFFAGYNATILAYGQTGSGKTYTMTADPLDNLSMGIIPRTAIEVFAKANEQRSNSQHMSFSVNFIEIYNETVVDLLDSDKTRSRKGLQIREDVFGEFFVSDVSEVSVSSSHELLELMRRGTSNRSVGSTLMNQGSSRSHSVFTLTLVQENAARDVTTISKLVLVDLAGSEVARKSGAEGGQFKEATSINLSLSTLGLVINALSTKGSKHIPYRNSSLTKLLKTSLGGNAKTSLIITCSPSALHSQESLSSLRFGERAKTVVNKSVLNETRRGVSEGSLLAELAELKQQLRDALLQGTALDTQAIMESISEKAESDRALIEKQQEEISALLVVLESKDSLLQEKERALVDMRRGNTGLGGEELNRQLRESVQVNNELVQKMAVMADMQQLDTLRATRGGSVLIVHSPSSPATKKKVVSAKSARSRRLVPKTPQPALSGCLATDSPYPSPEPSSPLESDKSMSPVLIQSRQPFNKENSANQTQPVNTSLKAPSNASKIASFFTRSSSQTS